jgi:phenylalanyl-tRNA synthetase alpha chain
MDMKMLAEIRRITNELESKLANVKTSEELEAFRIAYISRKGAIAQLFDRLRETSSTERPMLGKAVNELRDTAQSLFQQKKGELDVSWGSVRRFVDLTIPGRKRFIGASHPVIQTLEEMKRIFMKIGFEIATGPEVETDYYNFEALNFPTDHPARDMQDTFFISDKVLLRTHTSPVQIRVMERQKPPVRVIIPGRCYRNEAISARSFCVFHQMEGLYVDEGVTFSELKGTLVAFAKQFYGANIRYRFRPSFFPFTEPSAEMDITCFICRGKGCRVCKKIGWLEVLGCGMVDPNLYRFVDYDSEKYSGYAFGIGIERIAMLLYGIDDIRLLYENDMRLLLQF